MRVLLDGEQCVFISASAKRIKDFLQTFKDVGRLASYNSTNGTFHVEGDPSEDEGVTRRFVVVTTRSSSKEGPISARLAQQIGDALELTDIAEMQQFMEDKTHG